ncbi:MAG TPA: Rap1a/Tai family immunity protein [Allosphingosinicella sp.]|nr:Rap1a/Tai family immunity protein [Allosphingosinicella sp.]
MKRIAATATAAILLAGAAAAQPPAPRQTPRPPVAQPQRPPAQAQPQQRPPAQAQRPAAPAIPTRVTARTLTSLCGQDRNGCLTYVLGAADAFASALAAAGRPQVFCFPRGTTNDQIAQSVVRYLRANPQEGGNNAGIVTLAGLTASYPCGY